MLASASPRRVELLEQLGLPFSQQPADIDETRLHGESPATYVLRMAEEKAAAVAQRLPLAQRASTVIIGADTTVVIDERTLGKPLDRADGLAMLRLLSGRTHQVLTGICVVQGQTSKSACNLSNVTFGSISDTDAAHYWATGEPADKAGGYGIQGIGSIFIERIQGSYSGVMGLPLATLNQLLNALGISLWTQRGQ